MSDVTSGSKETGSAIKRAGGSKPRPEAHPFPRGGAPNPAPTCHAPPIWSTKTMANHSKRTRSKIEAQTKRLRNNLWPDAETKIWDYKTSDGWLNIPRSMPVIMRLLDSLTKGQPVSATYLELWCRTYNNGFVTANRPREMAFFSGFDGERAERTWVSRIRKLHELGFIDIKGGPSGPDSYILIHNPYTPLKRLRDNGQISERFWNALIARMIEIGADDLDNSPAEEKASERPSLDAQPAPRPSGRRSR